MRVADVCRNRIALRSRELHEAQDPHELLVPHFFGKALSEHLRVTLVAMTDPMMGYLTKDGGFSPKLNKLLVGLPQNLDECVLPVLPYMPPEVTDHYSSLRDKWQTMLDDTAREERKRRVEYRVVRGFDLLKRMVEFFAFHALPGFLWPGTVEGLKRRLAELESGVQRLTVKVVTQRMVG